MMLAHSDNITEQAATCGCLRYSAAVGDTVRLKLRDRAALFRYGVALSLAAWLSSPERWL